MIKGTRKEKKITVEDILLKISAYDIMQFYMPHKNWKLNEVTHSPFRRDKSPSFLIGTKLGNISFIDFGDTSKRGGCFDFVQMLYGIPTFIDTIKLIDKDFGLGLFTKVNINKYKIIVSEYIQPADVEKKYSIIQVVTKKFTKEELAYWNLFHQDVQDLKDNEIYSIKTIYLNKSLFSSNPLELKFGYFYEGRWKIYRPYSDKNIKWVPNNVPITAMDGKQNIKGCKLALINKSKKDYMVVKKIFPNSCAVQNEGIACFSVDNVNFLKENSETQLLSFDSDDTGVKNSQQITKVFDFGYINVPKKYLNEGIKDWADLGRIHGMNTIEKYFKQRKLI